MNWKNAFAGFCETMQQAADEKPLVIVITGPTASGKSDTALCLAEKLGGEIVSADSMQVYRGMDIGTAKVSLADRQKVPHHLIDILDPGTPFSVAAYQELAGKAIAAILDKGATPIVCGGTGQYLSALVEGLRFAMAPADPAIRARLQAREKEEGAEKLWQELEKIDPQAAARISHHDARRLVRALEIHEQTGRSMSWHDARSRMVEPAYTYRAYCLNHKRSELYRRIDQRVLQMVDLGLAGEAQQLFQKQLPPDCTCLQAIGYKEWFAFFQGETTQAETIESIQRASRRYAKRQLTWFRKMDGLIWLEDKDVHTTCHDIQTDLARSGLQKN